MEFTVLGSVQVHTNAGEPTLSGQLQRTLLGVLLARANQPVSVDVLVDALWGGELDERAMQRLRVHVHRLRQALGDDERLTLHAGGYRLSVHPGELDADRFEMLVDEAADNATHDPQRCVELVRKALGLWQGTPYDGLDVPELSHEAMRLSERRLAAIGELFTAEMACGRHGAVVSELTDLVARYPLQERFHALLMAALYRSGRQSDALRVYREARDTLVEELGLEPGSELRALEGQILAGEPIESIPGGEAPSPPQAVVPVVPAQLPRDVAGFVGRHEELAELDGLLTIDGPRPACLISGGPGVGKTALAVRCAHAISDRFPDGQLYLDLRGYGPDQPLSPDEGLAHLLRAVGVDGAAIPETVAERSAKWRSMLHRQRLVVVLDNAHDVEQVRPLLPATDRCVVLITSRDRLTGLVAREGAHRIDLDRMTVDEARHLLRKLLGDRADDQPDATEGLIELCARLPLALRIAAERIRQHRGGVMELVAEIADERARLDLLDTGGDPYTSMRAVFSWSFQRLTADVARAFRVCGLHPGHEFDMYALTALAGHDDLRATRRCLDALVRAHLVEETPAGRYRLHDLLWAYAVELTEVTDSDAERTAALTRLLDYYLYASSLAMDVVAPQRVEMNADRPARVAAAPMLPDLETALGWLDAERSNLVLVAERAADRGLHTHTMDLSTTLRCYLDDGSHVDDAQRLHARAVAIARDHEDRKGEATASYALGVLHHRRDDHDEATRHLERARLLYEQLGDHKSLAATLNALGCVCNVTGRVDDAARHFERSLDLYREGGHESLQAYPLGNLGWVSLWQGKHERALQCFEQALMIEEKDGDQSGQAHTLCNLAELCRDDGRYDDALEYAQRALALACEGGLRWIEGEALDLLGTVYRRLGDHDAARRHHRDALAVARTLEAVKLRAQALNGLGEAHAAVGAWADAAGCHDDALATASDHGIAYERARAHAGLGDAHEHRGDHQSATKHWQLARDLFRDLQSPEADELERKLARSSGGPAR